MLKKFIKYKKNKDLRVFKNAYSHKLAQINTK